MPRPSRPRSVLARLIHCAVIAASVVGIAFGQVGGPAGPRTLIMGPGCGMPPPELTVSAPALGQDSVFTVRSEFPDAHSFLFASAPTAESVEFVPGCFIHLDLATTQLVVDTFTDNRGEIVFRVPIPDVPALSGFELNFQVFVWGPGGIMGLDHGSNGVNIRAGDCIACAGKVSHLTLRYLGSVADALIEVKQKDGEVRFLDLVQPGGEFSFFGTDNSGNFDNEVKIRVNGGPETKFDTSCSKPIGPGLRKGEFEVVAGTSDQGGPLCPVSTCETGKPCRIVARYTGQDCSATVTSQPPDKHGCTGDPVMAGQVFIRATEKSNPTDTGGKIWFEGLVNLGDAFAIEAMAAGEPKLKSETFVHVFTPGGTLLQTVEFHTSCSQPIALFDQYGSIRIEQFFNEGTCSLPPGSVTDFCENGPRPSVLTMEYTGDGCGATVTAQDPSKVSCSGDPAMAPTVMIRASNEPDPADTGADVWFTGIVNLGETFDIDAANAGDTRLDTATWVHVFDPTGTVLLQTVEFHTSCSQPLRPDDQYGSLALRGYVPGS